MIYIKQEMIHRLSFSDVPVKKMELRLKQKEFKIFLKYARIKENNDNFFGNRTDMTLGEGVLVFSDWSDLSLLRDGPKGESFVDIDKWGFEPLEDVLIFDVNDNKVEISGFGMPECFWQKWTIVDSIYYGEFQEYISEK